MIPPRLSLSRDEKDLFDRARRELKPSAETRDQVRTRLRAAVAMPGLASRPRLEAIPEAELPATRWQPDRGALRRLPGMKLSLGLAGAVAIAGAAGLLIRSRLLDRLDLQVSPRGVTPSIAAVSTGGPGPASAPAPVPSASPPADDSHSLPLISRRRKAYSRAGTTHVAAPLVDPPDADSDVASAQTPAEVLSDRLAIEASLLERARKDLGQGDLVGARADLEEHRARFPSGGLTEEREALLVESVLRSQGPEAARSALQGFRGRFPRSFLLPALENAIRGAQP